MSKLRYSNHMVNAAQVEMARKAAGRVTPKQNVNGRAPSLKGKMAQVLIVAGSNTWQTFVSKVAIH